MEISDAYQLLAAESQCWAMSPEHLETTAAVIASGVKAAAHADSLFPKTQATTAVIPIMGPLTRRPSFFFTHNYADISRSLKEAVSARNVKKIILLVDSPGGAAAGVEELAAEIRAANRVKPVTAIADVFMASAAYWLGSQAGTIVATPSAEVGSVGTLMLHFDTSRALDKAGITPTFIVSKASPFKTEINSFEPLSGEAHEDIQQKVDEWTSRFVRGIATGRGISEKMVAARFGKGRTMLAPAALQAGLVDKIATFEQAISAPHAGIQRRINNVAPQSIDARRRRLRLEALR